MTRRISVTRRVAVGATLALTAGLGWVGAGPASAATPSVSCQTSNAFAKLSPGLSHTAKVQKESLGGKLGSCTGKVKISGGFITGTLTSPTAIRCQDLLGTGALGVGTEVLHWADGTTSTLKVTIKSLPKNNTLSNFTINGSVTKGRFQGHNVTAPMAVNQANQTNPGANCGLAFPPVSITQVNFSGTTTIS
jgi:hypothetical protein